MADDKAVHTKATAPDPDKVTVAITLGPVKAKPSKLTEAQVCRLLASVGNQVLTWMRYDVKDLRDIPVVCIEGTQTWNSKDGECHGTEYK